MEIAPLCLSRILDSTISSLMPMSMKLSYFYMLSGQFVLTTIFCFIILTVVSVDYVFFSFLVTWVLVMFSKLYGLTGTRAFNQCLISFSDRSDFLQKYTIPTLIRSVTPMTYHFVSVFDYHYFTSFLIVLGFYRLAWQNMS